MDDKSDKVYRSVPIEELKDLYELQKYAESLNKKGRNYRDIGILVSIRGGYTKDSRIVFPDTIEELFERGIWEDRHPGKRRKKVGYRESVPPRGSYSVHSGEWHSVYINSKYGG